MPQQQKISINLAPKTVKSIRDQLNGLIGWGAFIRGGRIGYATKLANALKGYFTRNIISTFWDYLEYHDIYVPVGSDPIEVKLRECLVLIIQGYEKDANKLLTEKNYRELLVRDVLINSAFILNKLDAQRGFGQSSLHNLKNLIMIEVFIDYIKYPSIELDKISLAGFNAYTKQIHTARIQTKKEFWNVYIEYLLTLLEFYKNVSMVQSIKQNASWNPSQLDQLRKKISQSRQPQKPTQQQIPISQGLAGIQMKQARR